MCKKLGKEGRRPAWLCKDHLVKLKHKKEINMQWKQGHTSWEEYRDTAWEFRDGIRNAKDQLEINLARMRKIIRASTGSLVRKGNKRYCTTE